MPVKEILGVIAMMIFVAAVVFVTHMPPGAAMIFGYTVGTVATILYIELTDR